MTSFDIYSGRRLARPSGLAGWGASILGWARGLSATAPAINDRLMRDIGLEPAGIEAGHVFDPLASSLTKRYDSARGPLA
jgi:hypothetical protein